MVRRSQNRRLWWRLKWLLRRLWLMELLLCWFQQAKFKVGLAYPAHLELILKSLWIKNPNKGKTQQVTWVKWQKQVNQLVTKSQLGQTPISWIAWPATRRQAPCSATKAATPTKRHQEPNHPCTENTSRRETRSTPSSSRCATSCWSSCSHLSNDLRNRILGTGWQYSS